jgi:hypothetical protein
MSTQTPDDFHDAPTDTEASVWPTLIATGSALALGYLLGRVTYRRDLQAAIHEIEDSPEPTVVSIRTL